MNLRPRSIDFDEVWEGIRKTVKRLICLSPTDKIVWDHNFRYFGIKLHFRLFLQNYFHIVYIYGASRDLRTLLKLGLG